MIVKCQQKKENAGWGIYVSITAQVLWNQLGLAALQDSEMQRPRLPLEIPSEASMSRMFGAVCSLHLIANLLGQT